MMDIEKEWDNLSISERVEIAKAIGLQGRISSAPWKSLHEFDKNALKEAHKESLKEEGIQDYLLWIGWSSYSTISSFISEAGKLGISRRISKIPKDIVLGKSKIFLAHDEGETGDAVIFGYYIPTHIEIIVFDDKVKGLRDIVTPVTLEQAETEEKRLCGFRIDVGSLYLISHSPSSPMIVFNPPRDYNSIIEPNGRRFRGIKKVKGQDILQGKAKREPSTRHKAITKMARQRGDRWTKDEIEMLRELTSKMKPRRAFREMAKVTGRSIPAMEYQFRNIKPK